MKRLFTLAIGLFTLVSLNSQSLYLGGNSSQEILVTSSDETVSGQSSINGKGLNPNIQGASRFLARATLGFSMADIQAIAQGSIEDWIENQLSLPGGTYVDKTISLYSEILRSCQQAPVNIPCPQAVASFPVLFRTAWWDNVMNGEDQLRQRVAMALSEILVISDQSNLRFFPQGIAAYYEILVQNAFGNYEDLLKAITTNMAMGFYLSHLNNPKTDTIKNIRPDENYAREFMQLFTIGLYELNPDGTRKLDANGLWIPTYDNNDIKGLAKVFTGLGGASKSRGNEPAAFGDDYRELSFLDPMIMYESFHEPGDKVIVGDYTVPGGQTGMQDIDQAINWIFNHNNVGPFIAHHLIQRLVKSNPTPEYVARIAAIFADNGSGVRGDLGATVKAILLDEEAMDCYWIDDMANGMLRAPMLRYTQLMRGLKAQNDASRFLTWGVAFEDFTQQYIMAAPTVFNFYRPDYEPNAEFSFYELVAPEFQIYNSSTSSNYINFMMLALLGDILEARNANQDIPNYLNGPVYNPFDRDATEYEAKLTDEQWLSLGQHPHQLVDYLDILLTNGNLTESTKSRMIRSLENNNLLTPEELPYYALFLIMIDPDYTIMR